MKLFILKTIAFLASNFLVYMAVVSVPQIRNSFSNNASESNLLSMTKNQTYDLLLMGTSHAKIFSRSGNDATVEKILSKKIFNISKGGGHGGIFPEYLFLSRFYEENNSVKDIFYFIDPWVFYSREWNEGNYFLEDEPIDFPFMVKAVKDGVDRSVMVNYLQSKLSRGWILVEPTTREAQTDSLLSVSETTILDAKKSPYMDGLDQNNFAHYSAMFESLLWLAEDHDAHVTVIFPATLLGDMPGHEQVKDYLKNLRTRHKNMEVYDFTYTITDPKYYYDTNHLNSSGIELFTKTSLFSIVQ